MTRADVVQIVLESMNDTSFLVCGLGYLARDVYHQCGKRRDRCFFCHGSMGSTIPLALGLALGRSGFSFVCLEGDGSLLMNLGALVTLKRYSSLTASLLKVVILDNRVYETTGGQRCQPDDFAIERVVAGVGLSCAVATEASDIEMFLCDPGKTLLVAKVDEVGEHAPRINEPPKSISERFRRKLCDLGPPKHD